MIRSSYPTIYGDSDGDGRGVLSFGDGASSQSPDAATDESGFPDIYTSFEGTDSQSLTEDELYDALDEIIGKNADYGIICFGIAGIKDFISKIHSTYGKDINLFDKTPLLDLTPMGILAFVYVFQLGIWKKSLSFTQLPGSSSYATSGVFDAN